MLVGRKMSKFWDLVQIVISGRASSTVLVRILALGSLSCYVRNPSTQSYPAEAPRKCSRGLSHLDPALRPPCQAADMWAVQPFLSSKRVHSLITWHPVTATDVWTNRRITQLSPAQFLFYKTTSSNGMVVALDRFGMLVATPPYVHFPLCSTWTYHIGAQFSDIYLSVFSSSQDKAKNFCYSLCF